MRRIIWLALLLWLSACTTIPITNPSPAAPTQPANGGSAQPPWASLRLSGRLILIGFQNDVYNLVAIDLVTGNNTLIYQSPAGALISSAIVSPDRKQIALTYAPPPPDGNQVTYTGLYLLPMDGSGSPQPIVKKPNPGEAFFTPTWAPDGKAIYASHFTSTPGDPTGPGSYSVDKVILDGQVQTVIKDAEWPSISPDGARLSYLTAGTASGLNDLFMADISGANPARVLSPGAYLTIDDHFYSGDGKSIIFSAVNPTPTPAPTPSILDRIFGIGVASAHTIPSDWYAISMGDGSVKRLTQVNDTGMYAVLSPDKKAIAFISQTGLYEMAVDGSGLTQLLNIVATGSVDWIP